MSIEAMKQALMQLNRDDVYLGHRSKTRADAIAVLRQAIAEAEKQEGWVLREVYFSEGEPISHREPQWVGLTDEEINEAQDTAAVEFKKNKYRIRGQMIMPGDSPDWWFARAIEAKLKEKNPVDETAKHEFEEMVKKGTKAWAGTPDNWVDDLRGGAEAEKQEPVAFRNTETGEFCTGGFLRKNWAKWQPLYAAPVQARPVVHAVRCTYPQCQATNGCVGACSKTAPVHASDISQEPVDETAKDRHEPDDLYDIWVEHKEKTND